MDTITKVTHYDHTCNRCHRPFASTFRGTKGLCPDCKKWYKETRLTHCSKCETEFDEVRDTKYGKEYHCSKCNSWINFSLLAEVFSVGGKR